MSDVTIVDHVLLRRLLTILRDRETPHGVFRQTLDDAAMILAYEAMRGLRPFEHDVQTPLETARGVSLADEVVIVAILRAGLGLVDGFLRLVPDARVGHLGMYRDEEALRPVGYYENIPSRVAAPEGVAALRAAHPEVPIVTAAVDRQLDENGYIRPGLGDAGDRIFGTDR